MVDERVRETIFMWHSLFNLPHRESVAGVHDRVVTPDYMSCTGDGLGDRERPKHKSRRVR